MRTVHTRRRAVAATIAACALLAAACGSAVEDSAPEPVGAEEPADAEQPVDADEPGGDDDGGTEWDGVVAAAREEGSVTIYTSQDPAYFDPIGDTLQAEYGIELNVLRDIDSTLAQRVDAELQTGNQEVDLLVVATPQYVDQYADAGLIVPPVGPNFAADEYPSALLSDDGSWEASAFITGLGWNTDVLPDGLEGYEDALVDELAGQIGVIEPAAPSIVDFWLWLEEAYGEAFVDRLAELEPRIYPSSLPINEALASGELAVGLFTNPPGLLALQGSGAPVDVLVPDGVWGSHFLGVVFADAPNPNAAQVLANYMVGPEGQAIVANGIGSARTDTEEALANAVDVRYIDEDVLTDDFVRTFQEEWREKFQ